MLKTGEKGAVLQRDKKSYAIVPHIPIGIVTPEQLKKIAEVAEKYELAALKLTSACRIAMVGFKEENIDQAWADLGMGPGAAVGIGNGTWSYCGFFQGCTCNRYRSAQCVQKAILQDT